MELQNVIQNRRSIRCFLSKPVSEETIRELINKSLWAPSWGNTQPWEIIVSTGASLEEFKRKNKEALLSGKPSSPEIPVPQRWPDTLKKRYKNIGKRVFQSLSITKDDHKEKRQHFARMYALFDAPALLLIIIDMGLSLEYSMLDIGLFLQTFCLLAYDRNLGTCILSTAVMYPALAHTIFSIPETKLIVIGAALGWPDPDAPINLFERERGKLEEFVRWLK